jgi:hypothetical protein
MIEKTKLPHPLSSDLAEKAWSARESWRRFGIMSEFVDAAERLGHICPAVSMFGSSRVPAGHPYFMRRILETACKCFNFSAEKPIIGLSAPRKAHA